MNFVGYSSAHNRLALLLLSFFPSWRWGSGGSEKVRTALIVAKLEGSRARMKPGARGADLAFLPKNIMFAFVWGPGQAVRKGPCLQTVPEKHSHPDNSTRNCFSLKMIGSCFSKSAPCRSEPFCKSHTPDSWGPKCGLMFWISAITLHISVRTKSWVQPVKEPREYSIFNCGELMTANPHHWLRQGISTDRAHSSRREVTTAWERESLRWEEQEPAETDRQILKSNKIEETQGPRLLVRKNTQN